MQGQLFQPGKDKRMKALEGHFVVAGTGSRQFERLPTPKKYNVLEIAEKILVGTLEAHPDLMLLGGGAEGWDLWYVSLAKKIGVPYALCIPNKGYGEYYYSAAHSLLGKDRREVFANMVNGAVAVEYTVEDVYGLKGIRVPRKEGGTQHSNFARNDRMVDLADAFIVYDPTSSGTKHCLGKIKAAGKPYRQIAKEQ